MVRTLSVTSILLNNFSVKVSRHWDPSWCITHFSCSHMHFNVCWLQGHALRTRSRHFSHRVSGRFDVPTTGVNFLGSSGYHTSPQDRRHHHYRHRYHRYSSSRRHYMIRVFDRFSFYLGGLHIYRNRQATFRSREREDSEWMERKSFTVDERDTSYVLIQRAWRTKISWNFLVISVVYMHNVLEHLKIERACIVIVVHDL